MTDQNNYLFTENTETLQIPYKEYVALVEKTNEAHRCREIHEQVLSDLAAVPGISKTARPAEPQATPPPKENNPVEEVAAQKPAAAPVESSVNEPEPRVEKEDPPEVAEPVEKLTKQPVENVPPIKADIAGHFNQVDASGRLFNIFKQYYTCMNDACGGTVRVTIKDGICSIWNYDEWEEFAFVDVFDGRLRIGVNPRYTERLKSLDLCEVPRLLANRHNLICVQVNDLNQLVLDILVTAFNEVGVAKK